MNKDMARMNEIESRFGQRVFHDVVPSHFDVGRMRQRIEETRVDVGGEHGARTADAIGHVGRYGSAPRPDFEASPAGHDADRVEMPARDRIAHCFERIEPQRALLAFIAEEIGRHDRAPALRMTLDKGGYATPRAAATDPHPHPE